MSSSLALHTQAIRMLVRRITIPMSALIRIQPISRIITSWNVSRLTQSNTSPIIRHATTTRETQMIINRITRRYPAIVNKTCTAMRRLTDDDIMRLRAQIILVTNRLLLAIAMQIRIKTILYITITRTHNTRARAVIISSRQTRSGLILTIPIGVNSDRIIRTVTVP